MSDGDGLSYREAGVDIDAGNEAVRRIKQLVASTRRPEQLDDIGGFAGMMALPKGVQEPVLVSCADGVGTKLLVAIAMGRHDSVGIDLVAMNVNDLICTGAAPLFVLDYIACGALDPNVVEKLVSGIANGCRQSRCALLGGETAELPGMYADGHYDLAAFAVGVVGAKARLDPANVRAGDVVLGLASSGLHSNGYSLARKALLDEAHLGLKLDDPTPGDPDRTVGDTLLEPTRIYVQAMAAVLEQAPGAVHSAAHITGGGLIENPPRALPKGLAMQLDLRVVEPLPVFSLLSSAGVSTAELRRTFNCGVGLMLVVDREREDDVRRALEAVGTTPLGLGQVVADDGGGAPVRFSDSV